MNIKVKKMPKTAPVEIEVKENITIEELVRMVREELPYPVLGALVDNEFVHMYHKLSVPCYVELLDMRNYTVNQMYQNSLTMIYLKAISDVLGAEAAEKTEIQNSINKGFYTIIRRNTSVTEKEVEQVQARMHDIVEQNLPFEEDEDGQYILDDYKTMMCGKVLPSTKYVKLFELRKYRRGVLLRFPHQKNPNVIPEFTDEVKLYEAFGEANNWGNLMEVSYVSDLNEKVKNGQYKELIQLSEALHEKKIADLAELIKKERRRVVLIAGPSSSGKTTFANRLLIQMKVIGLKPIYLGTDDYFVERKDAPLDEFGEKNFEDLEAVDVGLFNAQMKALLAGEVVDIPTFDFMAGEKKFGRRFTKIGKDQPIIIEGIHALNEDLTSLIPEEDKFKIYISPLTALNIDAHNRISTTDARMLRRMVRDNQFRGYSAKATIESWPKVRAGEDKNIFPYSNEADALFNSVHLYELSVLKKYAEPLLMEIGKDEPEYTEAQRMLGFLKYFEVIEDDSSIANNSILREFIGGSILV